MEAGLKRIKIFPVLHNIGERWFLDCFPPLPGINAVFCVFLDLMYGRAAVYEKRKKKKSYVLLTRRTDKAPRSGIRENPGDETPELPESYSPKISG